MKERSYGSLLPDGSLDLGNGVIGPSLSDQNHFNNPLPERAKRKANRLILPGTALLGLTAAACGGSKDAQNPQSQLNKKETSPSGYERQYELPFPEGETWFLTNGPHGDGWSKGVLYGIDIAPPEVGRLDGKCPQDGSRLSIDNRWVTASSSGEVVLVGNDKDRTNPYHSVVDIKDNNGLTVRYIHLDNTKAKVGDKVKQKARLGNPSCEFPPGGGNSGPHVHVGLMKDGQAIPVHNVEVGGWNIQDGKANYDGTMTKTGEKVRTADVRRCATDTACGGIRNDLPNKKNEKGQVVVAADKGPIQPISGKANEKSVEIEKEVPFAMKETPPTSVYKKTPVENKTEVGWTRFKSFDLPYQIDYPSNWKQDINAFYPYRETSNYIYLQLRVDTEPVSSWITLDDYKNRFIKTTKERITASAGEDVQFTETPNQSIDGQKAVRLDERKSTLVVRGSNGHTSKSFYNYRSVTYFTIKDGKAWAITYGADASEFDKNLPTFQKMLASFKFLK